MFAGILERLSEIRSFCWGGYGLWGTSVPEEDLKENLMWRKLGWWQSGPEEVFELAALMRRYLSCLPLLYSQV